MNPSALGLSQQHSRSTTAENSRQSLSVLSSTQDSPAKVETNDSYTRGGDGVGGDGGAGGNAGSQSAGGGSAAPQGGNTATTSAPPRIRRRNRMITSCLECRRRKLKCDRLHPCSNCAKTKRDCLFLAPALDPSARKMLAELKEKMGSLERSLEQDVVDRKTSSREGQVDSNTLGGLLENPNEGPNAIPEDEKNLKPTSLAVQDAAYEDGSDDDTLDLGFKLGKLRMTDRVGGFFRPKIAEEVTMALGDLSVSDKTTTEPIPKPSSFPGPIAEPDDSFFTPGPSYIAPNSDMFFGGGGERRYSLADFLPSRAAANRLLQQYWEAVDPIAKIVHRPTFERQYENFWLEVSRGLEPANSLQAVIFAALFSAAISMAEDSVLSTFGVTQKKLIENFQLATAMALGKANFLKTTKTQTLQALVMYMIPMCRAEVSRAHSVLVGTAIRLAECMGFHRDPEEYGLGPIETHVRRMIWYHLCFLDIRTSESHGPRLSIRRENFSTKFPLNIDEKDLCVPSPVPLTDKSQWTDMTYIRIRFECHELQRIINVDRLRIEKKGVSLTHVLGKIEAFRQAATAKFCPLFQVPNPKPIQKAAQLLLSFYLNRSYIALLHRYHNSMDLVVPDRLRQIIITSGTQQLEDAIELETNSEYTQWTWSLGAFNQWHTAFLLLVEVHQHPLRKESDRIWRCLYYAFETTPSPYEPGQEKYSANNRHKLLVHRDRKAREILGQLQQRMVHYRERRKLRIPVSMQGTQEASNLHARPSVRRLEGVKTSESSQPPRHEGQYISVTSTLGGPQTAPITNQTLFPPSQSHALPMTAYPQRSEPYQQPNMRNPPTSMSQWQPPLPLPQQQQQQQQKTSPPPQFHHLPAYSETPSQAQSGQFFYGPLQSLHNPHCMPDYAQRLARGQSLDSEATSEDSGSSRLWFLPGAASGSAGLAPPPPPVGGMAMASGQGFTKGGTQEDLPMLDIDWNEWDKLFPPEINTGDLNLPYPQAPIGESSPLSNFDTSDSGFGDQGYHPYSYGS
ncbi:fungal specific transcription factor domain-containing protein [Blastomyces dermatitidis ATCC 18188]|uniref:C6 finger domain transcription factor nscR n=1 Tax=Ajellomyces dermatitidis (strain ATCC 18188 / CBS 674.68) TaxID=653446 RepID=F2T4C7_AJEDA|nr:fungal specific transcription factor domain-containing protein [Blastomyces dermatitidis ATCC 18188]